MPGHFTNNRVLHAFDKHYSRCEVPQIVNPQPKFAHTGAHAKQEMRNKLLEHKQYICEYGDD